MSARIKLRIIREGQSTAWVQTPEEATVDAITAEARSKHALEMSERCASMVEHWRGRAEHWIAEADRWANVATQEMRVYANEIADERRVHVTSGRSKTAARRAAP